MHGLSRDVSWLVAQAQQEGWGSIMLPLQIFGVVAIVYVILLRPQRQEDKKRREAIAALKKNDKVVTTGGIYGTVTSVDTDRVVLRIDDEKGIKVAFARASVARVLEAAAEKGAES
jgi:preprotein translocase subunit YajC